MVSFAELWAEWIAAGVPEKRADGRLQEQVRRVTAARNPALHGTVARIIVLKTERGQHIGTLHEVLSPDGTVIHDHPKDYTRRDCTRIATP